MAVTSNDLRFDLGLALIVIALVGVGAFSWWFVLGYGIGSVGHAVVSEIRAK